MGKQRNQNHHYHRNPEHKSHHRHRHQHRQTWGTWEDLLLASAVKRHGFNDWDTVAMEIHNCTNLPHLLTTARTCEQKFLDLKRRFTTQCFFINYGFYSNTMSGDPNGPATNGCGNMLKSQEQQAKINEVRRLIGPLSGKALIYCSDESISRHLRARNWNVKKAAKMLKQTLKWRAEYKPEEIRWEDIANEAETGKIYRSNFTDKHGRPVLVMRPSRQNSESIKGQVKYLVYCMENAILNLPAEQEQMVWLIDFQGFNLSNISVKMVKPLLEPETYNKIKFVYSDDQNTKKIMEDLFDMDRLESSFGGNNNSEFDINIYAERMREDDRKMPSFWTRANIPPSVPYDAPPLDSIKLDSDSGSSDNEERDSTLGHEIELGNTKPDRDLLAHQGGLNTTTELR